MVPTKEMLNEYLHSEFKNVDAQAEMWYWAGIAAYAHLQSPGSEQWRKEHGSLSEKMLGAGYSERQIVKQAVELADALVAELKKGGQDD